MARRVHFLAFCISGVLSLNRTPNRTRKKKPTTKKKTKYSG